MLKKSSPLIPEPESKPILTQILSVRFTLVVANNKDQIDALIRHTMRVSKGKQQKTCLLTLALIETSQPKANQSDDVMTCIRQGGLILIDCRGSSSAQAETYNWLMDRNHPAVHPQLQIVAVTDTLNDFSPAFLDRFLKTLFLPAETTFPALEIKTSSSATTVIDLNLGGLIHCQTILQNLKPGTVFLRNIDEENLEVKAFLNHLLLAEPFPGVQLQIVPIDQKEWQRKMLTHSLGKITLDHASQLQQCWLVSSENIHSLFHLPKKESSRSWTHTLQGYLARLRKTQTPLLITEALDLECWALLLSYPERLKIFLVDEITVPSLFKDFFAQIPRIKVPESIPPRPSLNMVISDDPIQTALELQAATAESIIIHLNEDYQLEPIYRLLVSGHRLIFTGLGRHTSPTGSLLCLASSPCLININGEIQEITDTQLQNIHTITTEQELTERPILRLFAKNPPKKPPKPLFLGADEKISRPEQDWKQDIKIFQSALELYPFLNCRGTAALEKIHLQLQQLSFPLQVGLSPLASESSSRDLIAACPRMGRSIACARASGSPHSGAGRDGSDRTFTQLSYSNHIIMSPEFTFDHIAAAITTWAEENPIDKSGYRILVIQQAGVAKRDFFSFFKGMLQKLPQILLPNGQMIYLKPYHKVIFAGAAESEFQRTYCPIIECQPFLWDDLINYFINPELKCCGGLTAVEQTSICDILFEIQSYLTRLKIAPALGTMDIQAILSRFSYYRRQTPTPSYLTALKASLQSIVIESVSHPAKKTALMHYLRQRLGMISRNEITQPFHYFYSQLKQSTRDFIDTPEIYALTQIYFDIIQETAYWQTQDKICPGKLGLVVIGPTCSGKDFTIDQVLALTGTPYVHVNANTDLDDLQKKLLSAMQEGQFFVVSELNLLPTEKVNSLLSQIQNSHPKPRPGFRFIATNNSDYSGRQEFSHELLQVYYHQGSLLGPLVKTLESSAQHELLAEHDRLSQLRPSDRIVRNVVQLVVENHLDIKMAIRIGYARHLHAITTVEQNPTAPAENFFEKVVYQFLRLHDSSLTIYWNSNAPTGGFLDNDNKTVHFRRHDISATTERIFFDYLLRHILSATPTFPTETPKTLVVCLNSIYGHYALKDYPGCAPKLEFYWTEKEYHLKASIEYFQPLPSNANGTHLSKNLRPSSRVLSAGSRNLRGILELPIRGQAADKPRDDDVLLPSDADCSVNLCTTLAKMSFYFHYHFSVWDEYLRRFNEKLPHHPGNLMLRDARRWLISQWDHLNAWVIAPRDILLKKIIDDFTKPSAQILSPVRTSPHSLAASSAIFFQNSTSEVTLGECSLPSHEYLPIFVIYPNKHGYFDIKPNGLLDGAFPNNEFFTNTSMPGKVIGELKLRDYSGTLIDGEWRFYFSVPFFTRPVIKKLNPATMKSQIKFDAQGFYLVATDEKVKQTQTQWAELIFDIEEPVDKRIIDFPAVFPRKNRFIDLTLVDDQALVADLKKASGEPIAFQVDLLQRLKQWMEKTICYLDREKDYLELLDLKATYEHCAQTAPQQFPNEVLKIKMGVCQEIALAFAQFSLDFFSFPVRLLLCRTINNMRQIRNEAHLVIQIFIPGRGWLAFDPACRKKIPTDDLCSEQKLSLFSQQRKKIADDDKYQSVRLTRQENPLIDFFRAALTEHLDMKLLPELSTKKLAFSKAQYRPYPPGVFNKHIGLFRIPGALGYRIEWKTLLITTPLTIDIPNVMTFWKYILDKFSVVVAVADNHFVNALNVPHLLGLLTMSHTPSSTAYERWRQIQAKQGRTHCLITHEVYQSMISQFQDICKRVLVFTPEKITAWADQNSLARLCPESKERASTPHKKTQRSTDEKHIVLRNEVLNQSFCDRLRIHDERVELYNITIPHPVDVHVSSISIFDTIITQEFLNNLFNSNNIISGLFFKACIFDDKALVMPTTKAPIVLGFDSCLGPMPTFAKGNNIVFLCVISPRYFPKMRLDIAAINSFLENSLNCLRLWIVGFSSAPQDELIVPKDSHLMSLELSERSKSRHKHNEVILRIKNPFTLVSMPQYFEKIEYSSLHLITDIKHDGSGKISFSANSPEELALLIFYKQAIPEHLQSLAAQLSFEMPQIILTITQYIERVCHHTQLQVQEVSSLARTMLDLYQGKSFEKLRLGLETLAKSADQASLPVL